jgi:endo-1,3(4)-beta-glucanase
MWGRVSGNPRLEASGDLRIAIQTRVFCNYFLMESNNVHQPSNFIGNKVTGILFENKIDHATYFGGNIEYIQGIHMIPLSPVSVVFRRPKFGEFSNVPEFGDTSCCRGAS